MAWFTCMAGVGGKGNSVIVTCDADFAGVPITCTNGQKTYTKVCPSFSPYEVTFTGLVAGTWTISATVDGVVYSTTAIVTDITAVLSYGFNWKMWVDSSSSLHSSDYTDLADLLSDEAAIRQLFTEHAPTDYAASTATVTPDLATVLNNDLCAKWINLRDYALDTLYANPLIAAAMDSADKYFYGEWGIVDDTTTPPTWGAKGNVPIMTANNAPYGEASASNTVSGRYPYQAFTNSAWFPSANVTNGRVSYMFTNPVCVRELSFTAASGVDTTYHYSVVASNTGAFSGEETTLYTGTYQVTSSATTVVNQKFDNDNFYMAYGIKITEALFNGSAGSNIGNLQFYGRELSVSVPTMTSNTTPYGEASASSQQTGGYEAYKAFDNNTSTYWNTQNPNAGINQHITYHFTTPIVPKFMYLFPMYNTSQARVKNFTVRGSNDGFVNDSHDLLTDVFPNQNSAKCFDLDVSDAYTDIRLFVADNYGTADGRYIQITDLQFYGLDYSEKEFESGTTKKWLYDHGVELETLIPAATSSSYWNGQIITKEASYIDIKASSVQYGAGSIQSDNSIDLSPYNLMRAKTPQINISGQGHIALQVLDTKTAADSPSASIAYNISNPAFPNNLALDIQSINQAKWIAVTAGNLANAMCDLTEWWLE